MTIGESMKKLVVALTKTRLIMGTQRGTYLDLILSISGVVVLVSLFYLLAVVVT